MSKYKMTAPAKREVRPMSGHLRVLQQDNDWLYSVEIDLLDDRLSANGWRFANLDEHRAKFAGTPILIAYTHNGMKIGDGHNYRMKRTKDGREYASFVDATAERIIGMLSDDEKDIRIEVRDGHKWIVGKGKLWKWYAAEAVEKIAAQGKMDISIEALVVENHMDGNEEIETKYVPLGTTILGDDVSPAVAGANIRSLSEIDTGELRVRAASYQSATPADKADEQPATIFKGVKKSMNNAKRLREVEALFPDERVICLSDDGLRVCLMNMQNADIRAYQFESTEPLAVLDSRFCEVNPVVALSMANGDEIALNLGNLVTSLQTRVNELSVALNSKEDELNKANEAIREMQKKETERRRNDAKKAVLAAVQEINTMQEAKGEEKVDEAVCADVNAAIDNGEYDGCTDANGEWCGSEKACAAVKAKCMDAVCKASGLTIASKRAVDAWGALTAAAADASIWQNLD